MTDNELRNSVKEQVGRVIDDVYYKISNANNLKPTSKYRFNITITNPITKEIVSKKLSFQGDEIITARDFINKNRIKAGNPWGDKDLSGNFLCVLSGGEGGNILARCESAQHSRKNRETGLGVTASDISDIS